MRVSALAVSGGRLEVLTFSGSQAPPMKSGRRLAASFSSRDIWTATPVFWKSTASDARCALRKRDNDLQSANGLNKVRNADVHLDALGASRTLLVGDRHVGRRDLAENVGLFR